MNSAAASVWPDAIEIVEVSPRDGLQDYPVAVPTSTKIELIRRAAAAGARRIEVASFARPDAVPNMADAEDVIKATEDIAGLTRVGLVLNERGLDRALACGVDEINVVVVSTDTFSRRNQGMTVADAVDVWLKIARRAHAAGLPATVTLSVAFGCPFEGDVEPETILGLARRAAEGLPAAIVLADTIGAGVPAEVESLVTRVRSATELPVRCHLHDTRNTGVANAVAAIRAGATGLDASIGGLGGCPFAPSSQGNVATEDLVWTLERMGVSTGIDLDKLLGAVRWLGTELDAEIGGAVARAGPFPPSRSE